MLKIRDLHEVPVLFELSTHPEVYPYIRHKAETCDEFYFLTKQIIESEHNGELISRTITDEYEQPIGTINLYDIHNNAGFLATWIGQPYFGKGYNKLAKEAFLKELFFYTNIDTVYMKIRKTNKRSLKAATKIPYIMEANLIYPSVYQAINFLEDVYDLLVVTKEQFFTYLPLITIEEEENTLEADVVS